MHNTSYSYTFTDNHDVETPVKDYFLSIINNCQGKSSCTGKMPFLLSAVFKEGSYNNQCGRYSKEYLSRLSIVNQCAGKKLATIQFLLLIRSVNHTVVISIQLCVDNSNYVKYIFMFTSSFLYLFV